MSLSVMVDVTNPGQFFAACGLFELAARLHADTAAAFDGERFIVERSATLDELVEVLMSVSLDEIRLTTDAGDEDGDDDAVDRSASLWLEAPFSLRLDWWRDRMAGGRDLKVWAGTMSNVRIATAMFAAVKASRECRTDRLFDFGQVVADPNNPSKKVEPFYFDARRAPNAHSRDVGFSPDALDLTTTAFPAVELLCLIGLQRFRPLPDPTRRRIFTYRAWHTPLPIELAALVVAGAVPMPARRCYEFENWFRTGQKKHKAFRVAVPVAEGD